MTDIATCSVNGRWPVRMPSWRADRPEWPWWEAQRLAAMRPNIVTGDVVYDIGAEQGDFPALWATWGAAVVLVEPNPLAWPCIRATWEANFTREPLAMIQAFAGASSDGEVGFSCWPGCSFGDATGETGFWVIGRNPALTVTIDDIATVRLDPDHITIDIEGAELFALQGAHETLQRARPLVWVSIHPEFARDDHGYDTSAVHDLMASHGYRSRFLATDHEEHWLFWHPDRGVPVGVEA